MGSACHALQVCQSACRTANLPACLLTGLATRISASQPTSLSVHNMAEISLPYCQLSSLHGDGSGNQGLCQSDYKSVSPQLGRSQPARTANLPACIFMCLATRVSASQTTSLSVHNLPEVSLSVMPTFQPACLRVWQPWPLPASYKPASPQLARSQPVVLSTFQPTCLRAVIL